jgi:GDP-L-fucose synthase
MKKDSRIYVAGHRGLVGSSIMRRLAVAGYQNLITRTHAELDLTDQRAVNEFFEKEKPEYVFLAAAKVGGILANNTYPAEFIYQNLAIQTNVIHAAWKSSVQRLLFLGSSCIYPRECPQPIKEEYLLTGALEATNRPYALSKIAGIEMCWSYNRQYGTQYLSVMPTNSYGPGDNYNLNNSHVIPALIRKFDEAKKCEAKEVIVWGSGLPRREFLYCDDLAYACVYLINLPEKGYSNLLGKDNSETGKFEPPIVNIGCGEDITIRELAETIKEIVGFKGDIVFDATKPDGTPRKMLDISKLLSTGWKQQTSFQDGLKLSYEYYLKNYGG